MLNLLNEFVVQSNPGRHPWSSPPVYDATTGQVATLTLLSVD